MSLRILAAAVLALSVVAAPAPAQTTETVLTPRTFVDVAKKVLPSVVSIDTTLPVSQRVRRDHGVDSAEELFRKFWLEREGEGGLSLDDFRNYDLDDFGYRGSGSGVVVRQQDGWAYVVSNLHVIETDPRPHVNTVDPNARFKITLDPSFEARDVNSEQVELVGYDELTDIAVLRFRVPEGLQFEPVRFADSDRVEIGEWVLALGNPLELNNSVSQGIISAKNRSLGASNRIESLLQTTAVINPGNSGGPLVNLDGDIVGINNAIMTQTGRWAGIGFAIPSNNARYAVEQLIAKGSVSRGYLGISMLDVDDFRSSVYDLRLARGVSVEEVRPGTPAAEAGLRRGDIVIEVDDRSVANSRQLLENIAGRLAGDVVSMKVRRFEGNDREKPREVVVNVTLSERPTEEQLLRETVTLRLSRSIERQTRQLGFSLQASEEGSHKGFRVTRVEPGSSADRAGLRDGDLLIQLNGEDLADAEALEKGLGNVNQTVGHVVVFRRDSHEQTATLNAQ